MVSYDHFRQELRAQMVLATTGGAIDMLVTAGGLFDSVPKGARADLGMGYCCDAMRDEMVSGDIVLMDHDNGSGMTVRFLLPRLQPPSKAIPDETSEHDRTRKPLFGR
jgi:hypothetical protein